MDRELDEDAWMTGMCANLKMNKSRSLIEMEANSTKTTGAQNNVLFLKTV